jgi:hypothetical protein
MNKRLISFVPALCAIAGLFLLATACSGSNSRTADESADSQSPFTTLDIITTVIDSLRAEALTEEQLLKYFETNQEMLKENIFQATLRHHDSDLTSLVHTLYPQYIENKETIIRNYQNFFKEAEGVARDLVDTFGLDIQKVEFVPVLGLYSNGGWAGPHQIYAALERVPPGYDIGMLLVHESTHAISEIAEGTVLDQFYNEGFASYVTSVLRPGYPPELYFFISPESYQKSLEWIEHSKEKILADALMDMTVLDDNHKFYFSNSYTPYPSLGYIIGFDYCKHLNERYSLPELGVFGNDREKNIQSFRNWLQN